MNISPEDDFPEPTASDAARIDTIALAVKSILGALGEDTQREGLLNTPRRVAKALMHLTNGTKKTARRRDWQRVIRQQ